MAQGIDQGAVTLAIDPFSSNAVENAVSVDKMIRDAGQLVWLDGYGMWASANYETVKEILGDAERFSSAKRPFDHPEFPLPALLVTDDPPSHGPLRTVVSRILSPKYVRQFTDSFGDVAEAITSNLAEDQTFDAVSELAIPYVLTAFGDVMGLTPDGREHLVPFGNAVLNSFGPANQSFLLSTSQSVEASQWVMQQCVSGKFRANSVGALLFEAADRGEISHELAGMLMVVLLSAGVDTTVALIANMLYGFSQFPLQWERLRNDPKLALGAFEETHRWYSPSRMFGRVAHCETHVGGCRIKAGDNILLFVAATGRDDAVWQLPSEFDIGRMPGKHLSFGHGIHYCLGQMLARAEVMALITALSKVVHSIEPAGEPVILNSNTIQSFSSLPVSMKKG